MFKHADHPTIASTLCGIALDDPNDHSRLFAEPGELIQCPDCIAIQKHCMKFGSSHNQIWIPVKGSPKQVFRNGVKK